MNVEIESNIKYENFMDYKIFNREQNFLELLKVEPDSQQPKHENSQGLETMIERQKSMKSIEDEPESYLNYENFGKPETWDVGQKTMGLISVKPKKINDELFEQLNLKKQFDQNIRFREKSFSENYHPQDIRKDSRNNDELNRATNLFKCDAIGCNEVFDDKLKLRHHKYDHSGLQIFTCDVKGCQMDFLSKNNLESHRQFHFTCKESRKKIKCEYCGGNFVNNYSLKHHKQNHCKKKFKCSHEGCKKAFPSKDKLDSHELVHFKTEKIFKCDHAGCEKVFRRKDSWMDHKLTHSGIKSFRCNYCQKAFVNKKHCPFDHESFYCKVKKLSFLNA